MKVVFGYDGSECAERALDDLQKAGLPAGTEVCVLAVIEHWLPPPSTLEMVEHLDYNQEFLSLAKRAAMRLRELHPTWQVKAETAAGSPATMLRQKAQDWGADLIVVGSHGRTTMGRFFFGSVSQKIVHTAHCPVRIARGRVEEPGQPLRLLVGLDGSPSAAAAVETMLKRRWPAQTEVKVVTALWTLPPNMTAQTIGPVTQWVLSENARVHDAVKTAVERFQAAGLKAEAVFKDTVPQKLLFEEAETWDADCIFVGAHGMNAVERFMIGSVSSAVAARAHCSVEVVR
ncbi:MAG: universal stress protein [Acidobacteria bacterium]|nr:universal stress protein [Acidobacteriota bacterium]MBI3422209.1 universal stress protein [Acidobacteriota bacterium]